MRRKLEFWLDPAALHTLWDRTWNQWKHLLGTKIEVEGTFVQSGKYRKRREEWELVTWETALPSRLEVKLPPDFQQQMESAKTTYHRFGQYSRALDQIRLRLEHRAVERAELQRMCSEMRIPGDFDVAQISWRADYDPFFYRQLSRRARRIYLFRDEYIFDVEKAVRRRNPSAWPRDLRLRQAPEHGQLSRSVHQDHEGRHSPEPQQCRRAAGLSGPRDSRHESHERGSRKSGSASVRKSTSRRPWRSESWTNARTLLWHSIWRGLSSGHAAVPVKV